MLADLSIVSYRYLYGSLDISLATEERADRRLSERYADVPANSFDQIAVCGAGEDF